MELNLCIASYGPVVPPSAQHTEPRTHLTEYDGSDRRWACELRSPVIMTFRTLKNRKTMALWSPPVELALKILPNGSSDDTTPLTLTGMVLRTCRFIIPSPHQVSLDVLPATHKIHHSLKHSPPSQALPLVEETRLRPPPPEDHPQRAGR